MIKKIFIIHASEIIRRGLNAILRSYFNAEIILLEKEEELNTFCTLTGHEIVIICDNLCLQKTKYFHKLQKYNSVKWITFLINREETATPLPFAKFNISLQSEANQIQEMISGCFNNFGKTTQNNNSEELTTREKEVLQQLVLGHSNKAVADKLFISIHTVISHRKNISEKTGIKSISGLTIFAILNNLIDTKNIRPEELI